MHLGQGQQLRDIAEQILRIESVDDNRHIMPQGLIYLMISLQYSNQLMLLRFITALPHIPLPLVTKQNLLIHHHSNIQYLLI